MMSLTYWSCLNFFAEKTLYTLFYLMMNLHFSCNLRFLECNALTQCLTVYRSVSSKHATRLSARQRPRFLARLGTRKYGGCQRWLFGPEPEWLI